MDNNDHKFELLKMARELLNEAYINRRAEDHNRWVAESDAAWKIRRIKLPYPPFAPYPTETEIVAKAASLYSFLSAEEPAAEAPVVSKNMPANVEFVMETDKVAPSDDQLPTVETAPMVERVKAVEPAVETKVELVDEPIVVLDPVGTTVVTETKVEEVLLVEPVIVEPIAKTPVPEPKPLFAVSSWLQKNTKIKDQYV